MKRRKFLKRIAAAGPLIISARVLGLDGTPPSEQVRVGVIGLGGRCRDIAKTAVRIPDLRIEAVCDCFEPRVNAAMKSMGAQLGWHPYVDFREMIEKEHLDGVMVETTTHARAWITCHAMIMGMDVYIEKPMCLTISEGRHMVRLAQKYNRVTQVGTQQRSMPLNNWASDLVKTGALGKVREVLVPNYVGPLEWDNRPGEPMPEGGGPDNWWDVWTNQAPLRPYHRELHEGWAKWVDYDGGGISFGVSGWGTHSYDQVNRALGTDETGPVKIILEEAVSDQPAGKYERTPDPKETGQIYYHMAQSAFGPRARITFLFANGTPMKCHLDGDFGPGLGGIFKFDAGYLDLNRDKIDSDIPEVMNHPDKPAPLSVPETQPHIENWVQCIKNRQKCTADIEYGLRATTLCELVNIVRRVGPVGEELEWDPAAERFKNFEAGNAQLSRPRRAGYELPEA